MSFAMQQWQQRQPPMLVTVALKIDLGAHLGRNGHSLREGLPSHTGEQAEA
jgi:hypothetical protein